MKETPPTTLEDLLTDLRLARLFSRDSRECALQLWILQIKTEQSIENRVVYGRLLPYSHSSNSWHSSDDNHFQTLGQIQAQVVRLNLYIKSTYCADLLRQLSAGQTISVISDVLMLNLSKKLNKRLGSTAFAADKLAYRPPAYLLNRDAYDRLSLSSPHGGAGAISASISQIDKSANFRLGQYYDVAMTKLIVERLNTDTGLDFGGIDNTRFGDLELLVFPTLDDHEQSLLKVEWANDPLTLVVRFNSIQLPHFGSFQFRLSITNNAQIVFSYIATSKRDQEGVFECKFELSEDLRSRIDSTELEIFGFENEHSCMGTLCSRWRVGYIREINIQGRAIGGGTTDLSPGNSSRV